MITDNKKTAEERTEEKRSKAKSMTKATPAVRHTGNGNTHVITQEEIDVMGETELDATIANIMERRKVGNRALYPNVESLENAITAYWAKVQKERQAGIDVIPDVEHLCSHLGVSRRTFNAWERENYNGFQATIEMVKNDIAALKNQLALQNKIPQLVWATMMNNNHGYTQQTKLEVQNTSAEVIPSAASLLEQVRNLPGVGNDDKR